MHRNEKKKIAICIPTYNREKELKRLLKSITAQEIIPLKYDFEILIVDNNIVSYMDSVFNEFDDDNFMIHSINVRRRGLANVRNAAVSWVLDRDLDALIFVDDDEVVTPDWLNNMVIAWEKYGGDIITGPVVQTPPMSAPWLVKKFHLLENNLNQNSGAKLQYACSGNTLVSKKVLLAMGPSFHPSLNRTGGEDTLFFHQCYLKGFKIYWDNSIMIKEPTTHKRTRVSYILKRWFHNGMNRIPINQILYPRQWRKISFKLIIKTIFYLPRGFAASIIQRDNRKLGKSLCRLFWLAGNIIKFVGITSADRVFSR
jgi:glycosyltransferase involved in cell wall biosynthesis